MGVYIRYVRMGIGVLRALALEEHSRQNRETNTMIALLSVKGSSRGVGKTMEPTQNAYEF